jgi:hypothetical protein
MKDENGKNLTEKEILEYACELLSDACCHLFELDSQEGQAVAFMADATLKLAQVIMRDDSPLEAACDYEKYEHKYYLKVKKNITVIK